MLCNFYDGYVNPETKWTIKGKIARDYVERGAVATVVMVSGGIRGAKRGVKKYMERGKNLDFLTNNKAPKIELHTLKKTSPIKIPKDAIINHKMKGGGTYRHVSFRWWRKGYRYEVRWHTKTPNAPKGTKPGWVVERTRLGNSNNVSSISQVLVREPGTNYSIWKSKYKWTQATGAYRSGTATSAQLDLMKRGHYDSIPK